MRGFLNRVWAASSKLGGTQSAVHERTVEPLPNPAKARILLAMIGGSS